MRGKLKTSLPLGYSCSNYRCCCGHSNYGAVAFWSLNLMKGCQLLCVFIGGTARPGTGLPAEWASLIRMEGEWRGSSCHQTTAAAVPDRVIRAYSIVYSRAPCSCTCTCASRFNAEVWRGALTRSLWALSALPLCHMTLHVHFKKLKYLQLQAVSFWSCLRSSSHSCHILKSILHYKYSVNDELWPPVVFNTGHSERTIK